MAVDSQPSS